MLLEVIDIYMKSISRQPDQVLYGLQQRRDKKPQEEEPIHSVRSTHLVELLLKLNYPTRLILGNRLIQA